MDKTKKPLEELKAIAYDIIVQLEQLQKNLQVVNGEIAKKTNEHPKSEINENEYVM